MEILHMLSVEQSTATLKNVSYSNRLEKLYQAKTAQLMKLSADPTSLRFLVLRAEAEAICQELEQFFRK